MSVLSIRHYPNEVLSQPSLPVPVELILLPTVQKLVDDMIETMYSAFGIGLSAPQVGYLHQILVVGIPEVVSGTAEQTLVMINPVIISSEPRRGPAEAEGCLSVPNVYEPVLRPDHLWVEYLDRFGRPSHLSDATGLLARAVHHEIDHLNGVVFIDKVSRLKRNMALKHLKRPKYPVSRSTLVLSALGASTTVSTVTQEG